MNSSTFTVDSCIRTVDLVRKDLRRFFYLVHGEGALSPTTLRLWLFACSPRYLPVLLYRISHGFHRRRLAIPAKLFSSLNFLIFGIEITPNCPIGPGLFLPHASGTVIGAASIGANATIFQGVTLGSKLLDFNYAPSLRPRLGSGITVGAGSKVLGGIHIGDNVTVGANAVVISSLPANCVAVGIPAKVL
jgi:serine O-acetyltransferase